MVGEETKREAWIRLITGRGVHLEEALRKIGNLSNHYNYDFDKDLVESVFRNIEKEVAATKEKYLAALKKKKNKD